MAKLTPEEIFERIDPIEGWFDLANVRKFCELELPPKPVIFECGTYKGRSATAFSLIWPDAEIYTCDPVDEPGRQLPSQARFINKRGVDILWEKPIDLLFIDDSHLYRDIRANFNRFQPFVKSGGLIVFHDYHFPTAGGVKEFVDELGDCMIDTRGEYGLAIWRKP